MSSVGTACARSDAPRWFVLWISFLTGVVAVVGAALCWELAAFGDYFTKVLLWVGLSVVSVIALLFGLVGLVRYHAIQLSLAVPLSITALAALVWFEVPQEVGWQVSRGILEDQSIDCTDPGRHTRLGVYTVTAVTPRDGGCLFYVQGASTDLAGFAYFAPENAPPNLRSPAERGVGYRPYDGRWYRFVDSS
ncbi:hypothetical protein [Nocardia sp. NPDC051463]|uniref:hypothetical protein n=1 Tax=Nocardia sp. NPDC051463 TaxID=3154845 RepID=UPI00343FEACA